MSTPGEERCPAAVIRKIAQVAAAVGFQAGVPASDVAGMIVSVLAAHPEWVERFMDEGSELFIDGSMKAENGSLSYRAMTGAIMTPAALRASKGRLDQ